MNQPAREQSSLQHAFLTLRGELEHYIERRVRCPQLAEDLASEIYLRLENVDFPGTPDEALRYLYRMAANISIDHFRNTKRRAQILEEEGDLFTEETTDGPERAYLARADLAIVNDALEELPPRAREILFDARIGGMSYEAIAKKYGVSRSLVDKYVLRSLRHCKVRLREAETGEEKSSGGWYKRLRGGK